MPVTRDFIPKGEPADERFEPAFPPDFVPGEGQEAKPEAKPGEGSDAAIEKALAEPEGDSPFTDQHGDVVEADADNTAPESPDLTGEAVGPGDAEPKGTEPLQDPTADTDTEVEDDRPAPLQDPAPAAPAEEVVVETPDEPRARDIPYAAAE